LYLAGRRRSARPKSPKLETVDSRSGVSPQETPLCGKFSGLVAAVKNTIEPQDEHGRVQDDACNSKSSSPDAISRRRRPAQCGSRYMTRGQLEVMMAKFEAIARQGYLRGSPRADRLLTLNQFNVLRALLSNTFTLGWTPEWLECSDLVSPWNALPPDSKPLCPQALRPTPVQRTIRHHPWIDLWPIPKMRDNLLLAGDSYDEDQLCNDLVEFNDILNEQTGLVVWGEPWDPKGWEVSKAFSAGCVELLESTNYWRSARGEKPLVFNV